MRSSGCTIQQALTAEAESVVKQAVSLAKRRGHAQVTPLHVANTMLSSSPGLFRAACLQSHSHPFQCRALELCFNVALNRLPTSTSNPMLGPYHHHHNHPSISNALVAAFKRAQAHQRRGSIENQQQPLLAVKIELDQLIISILDDPSVSRVMREAGFSSTLVKEKVEQAVSVETNSQSNTNKDTLGGGGGGGGNSLLVLEPSSQNSGSIQAGLIRASKPTWSDQVRSEDVTSVIDGMLSKRKRCCVVVGECLATLEGAVRGVMDRIERGDVPDALKEVRFEPLSLDCFGHLSYDEIVQKVAEITCLVKSYATKGLVLYLGDLKWAIEFRGGGGGVRAGEQRRGYYCPIEHVIMELRRLILDCNETGRLWLVGVAAFQTYTRCGSGQPSLEALWSIHAITIPAGSLGLSLIPESDSQSTLASKKMDSARSWLLLKGNQEDERHTNLHSNTCNSESTTPSLPSWLQKCKDENRKPGNDTDQDSIPVKDLCRSWSFSERTLSFSSVSPSSTSGFPHDGQKYFNVQQTHHLTVEVDPKCFWVSTDNPPSNGAFETTFTMYVSEPSKVQKCSPFSLKPCSIPNSTSSSYIMEMESTQKRFKDYNAENLENLCSALEKKVPWQRDIIRDIATTVLNCRSGKVRRKGEKQESNDHLKEETWLLFQGADLDGKEKIARELARVVFGSENKYISIDLSNFSSTEDSGKKRLRNAQCFTFSDRLVEAITADPHRVFFVEVMDQVDYISQVGIKRAIERGKMRNCDGEEVSLSDAIIILSCERCSSRSRACSPSTKQRVDHHHHGPTEAEKGGCCSEDSNGNSISPSISLDLNISISDDCVVDQDQDQSSVDDPLRLLAFVDTCIMFKLQEI